MKRLRLKTLSMLSILIASILVCSCSAYAAVRVGYHTSRGPSCFIGLMLIGGGVVTMLWWDAGQNLHPGLDFKFDKPLLIKPFFISPLEFTAGHSVGTGTDLFLDGRFVEGMNSYCVCFPFWVALMPCLIAPTLWVKRRRQNKKAARGFSVISPIPE